ncbi:hypothetical protein C823_005419 [Eubacterium plexicaudatum ASF492]|uniref:Uncharacterized protein n=1 Tax=Eubacterium plexicaudatum ASF492 TaxID=1235802 RepID=N2AXI6_9FIRM|nr:hypothetical protein C823_005419 [Eubacterium plexicaudatum ASF492]
MGVKRVMHILMSSLYSTIKQFSQIVIYGAGNYANLIYSELKKVGLKEMISSFVVTNLDERDEVDGIPVKSVGDISVVHVENCAVLIAVSEKYESEIIRILQNMHFAQIVKLTDYILQNSELIEMFRKQTDEQFIESIVNEYAWSNIDTIQKLEIRKEEMKNFIVSKNIKDGEENTIVYISGHLNARSKKIIGALIKRKYKLIVIEYGVRNELIRSEIMLYNINFITCKDIIEVFWRAVQYTPLIYYYEPIWADSSGSEIMIKHKNVFGKIVFAPYDILNGGYVKISGEKKLMERYCLENADGVVWRWFSKDFLEEKKGFSYKGKSVQFLDYCGGYRIDKYSRSDKILKICFVVWGISIFLERDILKNDGQYIEHARIDTILDKIGNRNDCIFHVYIGQCDSSDRKKLELLESQYFNFKAFYEIEHNDLITRISEYDYGCLLSTEGKEIPEMVSIDGVYYGSTFQYGVLNKYFDYLDAGIPIIATGHKKFCDYFERLGVLVKMNVSTLDVDYLKEKEKFYRKNVEQVRKTLLIDNQISRLIEFFENL